MHSLEVILVSKVALVCVIAGAWSHHVPRKESRLGVGFLLTLYQGEHKYDKISILS